MMRALALSLALSLSPAQVASAAPVLPVELRVDACVDVEREELLQLLTVELAGVSTGSETLSVEVTCTDQAELVRITTRSGRRASTRELDLRAAGQAARRARARELSLLIAESVKAREEPARAEPAAAPTPPRPVPRPSSHPKPEPAEWLELSVAGGVEKYSGGYAQLGPTASARLLRLAPLVFEARFGGRWAPDLQAPAGVVRTRAWLAALGVGVDVLPRQRSAGLSLLARFECDWVLAEGESRLAESQGLSDQGRAYLLSLASSASVRLSQKLRLMAEPALVIPLRELKFRDRERTVASLSGFGAAASVGLSLRL